VPVTGVVEDEIEDDGDAAVVGLADEAVEVGHRAEQRIDGGMVGHVVAEVEAG